MSGGTLLLFFLKGYRAGAPPACVIVVPGDLLRGVTTSLSSHSYQRHVGPGSRSGAGPVTGSPDRCCVVSTVRSCKRLALVCFMAAALCRSGQSSVGACVRL